MLNKIFSKVLSKDSYTLFMFRLYLGFGIISFVLLVSVLLISLNNIDSLYMQSIVGLLGIICAIILMALERRWVEYISLKFNLTVCGNSSLCAKGFYTSLRENDIVKCPYCKSLMVVDKIYIENEIRQLLKQVKDEKK